MRTAPPLPSAVRALRSARGPLVLAVSGGLDSMVLLHVAAHDRSVRKRCTVATFDHGTGPHAANAVRLVRDVARSLGIPFVTERAHRVATSEADWRDMRWRFLRTVAQRRGASIVTGHTRDDQIETVVMRILRGAGARGIAALYADDAIVRPLLTLSRRRLERVAAAREIQFVEDPTNADRRYLRNRVRHDLLPALREQSVRFDRDMLAIARRAARLRRETEKIATQMVGAAGRSDHVVLRATDLSGIAPEGLAILWPAIVAQLGVALDRRGVTRATEFALYAHAGQRAQCSGGITLDRTRETFVVRRSAPMPATVHTAATVESDRWSVRAVSRRAFEKHIARSGSAWGAVLHDSVPYEVRSWRPGDRVHGDRGGSSRRVKRYFSELSIPVSERQSWPVVVVDGRVRWVPGVYQPSTAVGALGSLTYLVCERR